MTIRMHCTSVRITDVVDAFGACACNLKLALTLQSEHPCTGRQSQPAHRLYNVLLQGATLLTGCDLTPSTSATRVTPFTLDTEPSIVSYLIHKRRDSAADPSALLTS